ncbi:MAG TPA: prepilin peptidase [Verrucomicrobiae bacterium]|nr:prepilin peptidase [Verrucomicrobiae bacterium]
MWLHLYLDFVVFVFGAVVGSFLNVCIHRMPREESIVTPPSHCPHCGARIRWTDNIPLVSFILLRGKCRHCGARIHPRYVVIELLTALLFLAIWLKLTPWERPPAHGIDFLTIVIYWMVMAGLIVATFIDLEHYIIPNEITFGGIMLGLVLSLVHPRLLEAHSVWMGLVRSLLGLLVGGLALLLIAMAGEKVFKKEAMGMGDVKLIAAIGAFLGWQATLFTIFLSSLVGGVVGLILVLASKKGWQSRIPYGPYLALGAIVWIFCGKELVNWYFKVIQG